MIDEAVLAQRLAERRIRLTPQRRAVLSVVAGARSRLSAADVHARACKIRPDLGLATVYRTLDILSELGSVRRVHMDDRREGFAASSLEHGHHVICRSCGRAVEFAGCDISSLVSEAALQTGFRIDAHTLELFGECDDCGSIAGRREPCA